jgi:hypothetical protein
MGKRTKIRAEAVAKIEATARATYQRKKTTTEVIPPDVTRAKTGAWLALVSPLTEWAGLRGDQLRHKRDLLRIQQDAALSRIARQARQTLQNERQQVVTPVPTKFLVSFLEKGSLEDPDSDLCDRWSDLLVSAATAYDPSMVRFSGVLAEIGSGEVALLERMIRKRRGSLGLNHIEDVPILFSSGLSRMIKNFTPPQNTEEDLQNAIIDRFEYPGTAWPFLGVDDWDFSNADWSEKEEAIASNLVSVGVLHHIDDLQGKVGKHGWYGRVYALTSFGLRFIRACDCNLNNELAAYEKEFEKESAEMRAAEKEKN